MSVGLQALISKHRDRTHRPLCSKTTEKEMDVQSKQELTSLSCIKTERETDSQTLSSVQIKQEPQDLGKTRESNPELTFHSGNVKTEPQDIEQSLADQGKFEFCSQPIISKVKISLIQESNLIDLGDYSLYDLMNQ